MSSSSTPCGKHIDFDKEATSYLVHDLLLSFLYSYAHIQDDTQRSALARQELLARAVTELLHHFSFPAHVSIPVVDMCILLRHAIRRWLNSRLPLVTADSTKFAREAGFHWRSELLNAPHHPYRAIHARTHFGRVDACSRNASAELPNRTAQATALTSFASDSISTSFFGGDARSANHPTDVNGLTGAERQVLSSHLPSRSASQHLSLESSNLSGLYQTRNALSLKRLIMPSRGPPSSPRSSISSSRATSRALPYLSTHPVIRPSRISPRLSSDQDIRTALELKGICLEDRGLAKSSRSTVSSYSRRRETLSALAERKIHSPAASSSTGTSSSAAWSRPGLISSPRCLPRLVDRPAANLVPTFLPSSSVDLITDASSRLSPWLPSHDTFPSTVMLKKSEVSISSGSHVMSLSPCSPPKFNQDIMYSALTLSPSIIGGTSFLNQNTAFQRSQSRTGTCNDGATDSSYSSIIRNKSDLVITSSLPDAAAHLDDTSYFGRPYKGYTWVEDVEEISPSTLVSVVTVLPKRTTRSGHVFG